MRSGRQRGGAKDGGTGSRASATVSTPGWQTPERRHALPPTPTPDAMPPHEYLRICEPRLGCGGLQELDNNFLLRPLGR